MSGVEIEVEAEAWRALPELESLVREAASLALSHREAGGVPAKPGSGALAVAPSTAPRSLSPADAVEDASFAILLTDDAAVRELNRQWRGKDQPTNVLSFPAAETAAPWLGDVALAWETCAREAAEQNKAPAHHVTHLVVHGVLHLLGWDHQTDAEAESMEALERDILARLGVPDPYGDRGIPLAHG